ncbi:hypothetical protein [Nocardia lijiangensis]
MSVSRTVFSRDTFFGRLEGAIEARARDFDHQMNLMAGLTGLPKV